MNIWVIGRSFPMSNNNLRGSFEWEQASLLSRRGHKITYLACVFHHKNRIRQWGYTAWKENGIQIHCYSQLFAPERFNFHCQRLRSKRWLELMKKAEDQSGLPDVIHLHYPSMLCETEVLEEYQKRGVKIVSTEHWSRVMNKHLRSFELNRLKWHINQSNGIAAVSTALVTAMQELTSSPRHITVIPNVINPLFKPHSQKPNDGVFRFVTVGRLVSLRQYDKVIVAFDALFHGRNDVTLTLIGTGEEKKRLSKMIEALSAQNNIFMAGILARDKCAEAVANSDCLICYSKYETFGVPIIEAWGCGVPVIAPKQLGLLDDENGSAIGIAADTDNINSLCDAMRSMVESENRFDPQFISSYAISHFSESAVYEKILSLYQSGDSDTAMFSL